MALPDLILKNVQIYTGKLNKKGQLCNQYAPFYNLVNSETQQLSEMSTSVAGSNLGLNFDLSHPVDIIPQVSYDGSVNLVLNDDKSRPRLINSRFSVQENNTFLVPQHAGFHDNNIYEESDFELQSALIQSPHKIPKLKFKGLLNQAGKLQCGTYIFYFKYKDADGNDTTVQAESGLVQCHIGQTCDPKSMRFGLEDEVTDKAISFELSNIDLAYTSVQVYFARISGNEQGTVTQIYKINNTFDVNASGICNILITGSEDIQSATQQEISTEYADIQSAKTQTQSANVLLLGNVQSTEHDWEAIQRMSWKIIPTLCTCPKGEIGYLNTDYKDTVSTDPEKGYMYYNMNNVYYKVGYWPNEFYRFGIVYIFNDGTISRVIQIPGVDFNKKETVNQKDIFRALVNDDGTTSYEEWLFDPEDHWFQSDKINSKGVFRFANKQILSYQQNCLTATPLYLNFDLSYIGVQKPDQIGKYEDRIKLMEETLKKHNIKGYFFVRQIRKPTILCQGLAIKKSDKDRGNLPLLSYNNQIVAQSFLNKQRYISHDGDFTCPDVFETQALLAPDVLLQKPIFNDLFTSSEYHIKPISRFFSPTYKNNLYTFSSLFYEKDIDNTVVRLTNVNEGVKSITNGEDFFSTIAGEWSDTLKKEDLKLIWDRSLPQDLSVSTTLVRGLWGSYVGLSKHSNIKYGHLCNIMTEGWDNSELQTKLMFQQLMSDDSDKYYTVSDRYDRTEGQVNCFRGDCYPSLYTHRMFRNFIDTDYPTNKKIIAPYSWAQNYAVRCTAYLPHSATGSAFNNCSKGNEGWFLKNSEVNLKAENGVFNQIAQTFELDVARISGILSYKLYKEDGQEYLQYKKTINDENVLQKFIWSSNSTWIPDPKTMYNGDTLKYGYDPRPVLPKDIPYAYNKGVSEWYKHTWLTHPEPPKKTGLTLVDMAVTLADASSHEYVQRGTANINRADINAVALGQWITFPVCSSMNLALRDIDFTQATEESMLNQKRGFYPFQAMNKELNIAESDKINKAAKISIGPKYYETLPDMPFIKEEYFNRIYFSLVDIGGTAANEWKEMLAHKYIDVDKQYGSITKLIGNSGSIYIIFEHGIGYISFTQGQQGGLDLSSVQMLNHTYGSMWKDSIIETDFGIFGVDTVAKVIWHLQGMEVRPLSDQVINKFLIDNIDLSEYVKFPYIGHINVKTHYNANKRDVMFTYYNDIPYSLEGHTDLHITDVDKNGNALDSNGNIILIDGQPYQPKKILLNYSTEDQDWENYNSKIVDLWVKGKQWSICYNCITQCFQTFYDWIPLESANIDNIFFTFDKNGIDEQVKESNINYPELFIKNNQIEAKATPYRTININTIDFAFNGNSPVYHIPKNKAMFFNSDYEYISMYYKAESLQIKGNEEFDSLLNLPMNNGWTFGVWRIEQSDRYRISSNTDAEITQIKCFILPVNVNTNSIYDSWEDYCADQIEEAEHLRYYNIRDYENSNRMYLWKHGQAGIYDNQGKIKPTNWYGKQHEFNFEFVAKTENGLQGIFNNLKMIANKAQPKKFEYEIVGEGYQWQPYKPVVYWANKKVEDGTFIDLQSAYYYILNNDVVTIRRVYYDFPETDLEYKAQLTNIPYRYKKLPYLQIELSDKKGRKDKSYNLDACDAWQNQRSVKNILPRQYDHTFNTTETVIKYDEQLNEYRIHDEQLGNDVTKYGRLRGNMQYLEDCWNIEIRPLNFKWGYLDNGQFKLKTISETKHRDKYIKIKVRYSGEDLALIQQIYTLYDESYA